MRIRDLRKEKLCDEIIEIIKVLPTNVRGVVKKGMTSYFNALKTFGPRNPITKQALISIKEILQNYKMEKVLFYFILDNIESMDYDATRDVVSTLEDLDKQTISDYNCLLDNINNACEKKDDERVLLPEGRVNSLLSNKKYEAMVIGLTETISDVKAVLPYEEEFWEYIKPKLRVLQTNGEGARHECGFRLVYDENNKLHDIPIIAVPKVVDYETAMEAIRIYKRAHYLYSCLGKDMSEIQETNANEEQMQYRKNIEKKANRQFR